MSHHALLALREETQQYWNDHGHPPGKVRVAPLLLKILKAEVEDDITTTTPTSDVLEDTLHVDGVTVEEDDSLQAVGLPTHPAVEQAKGMMEPGQSPMSRAEDGRDIRPSADSQSIPSSVDPAEPPSGAPGYTWQDKVADLQEQIDKLRADVAAIQKEREADLGSMLSLTKEEDVHGMARWLHYNYEEIADQVGWDTQEGCTVAFEDLPKDNQAVMVGLANRIIEEAGEDE